MKKILILTFLLICSTAGISLAAWVRTLDGVNFQIGSAMSNNSSMANSMNIVNMTMNQINAMAQTGGQQWVEVRSAAQMCLNSWQSKHPQGK